MRRAAHLATTLLLVVALALVAAQAVAAQGGRRGSTSEMDRIERAIGELRSLDAYAFLEETEWQPFADGLIVSDGVVIRRPEFRFREVETIAGEASRSTLVTPDGAWVAFHGSELIPARSTDERVGTRTTAPFDERLRLDFAGSVLAGEDLGAEMWHGQRARHLRLVATLDSVDVGEVGPIRGGFSGTIDVWIAQPGGWLLELAVDGTYATPWTGDDPPPPTTHTRSVRIDRVNDTTLTVDPPAEGPVAPTPSPVGDPVAAAMVQRAYAALESLASYRMITPADLPFIYGPGRSTVINEPPRRVELRQDMLGTELRLFATDHEWWTSSDEFGWSRRDGAFFFDACEGGGCLFPDLVAIADDPRSIAATFVRVGDELLDGIPAIRLRSDAGMMHPHRRVHVPGTWDVWVARDGGHLLRQTFDGSAFERETRIEGVDDPANVLEVPES